MKERLKRLGNKTDQISNLLRSVQIASTNAKVACGAHHATSQPKGVVAENRPGSPIVVLGADARDERLDVQLRWAALLARGIGALQAAE
jgi:hypothetical protein